MQTTLGRTGLTGSPITFGTWQLSGHWGPFDEAEAIAAIRRARELGVTVFDTAHFYGWGEAEHLLGRALREDLRRDREDVVIVTKGGLQFSEQHGPFPDSSVPWLRQGIETSLRSLGVDHLDVYLLHVPDTGIPFEQTAAFLQGYVDRGVIRHVGLSNFDAAQTARFAVALPVGLIEPPYNVFQRGIEEELLGYARQHELGVITYSTLASGLLSGGLNPDTTFTPEDWRYFHPLFRGEAYRTALGRVDRLTALARDRFGVPVARLAIAWALANPDVDSAIVGMRSRAHVEEAVRAAELLLEPADLAAVDDVLAAADSVV